jgi:hypothetical protein
MHLQTASVPCANASQTGVPISEPKCQKSKYFTSLGTYPGSPLLGKTPGRGGGTLQEAMLVLLQGPECVGPTMDGAWWQKEGERRGLRVGNNDS